jgi:hypothetical protein
MRLQYLLAGALLLSAQPLTTDYLTLCGVRLQIGMLQETALADLSRQCKVELASEPRRPESGAEEWRLSTKTQIPSPVGDVIFDGHKALINVSMPWADKAGSQQLVDALFYAVTAFDAEGRTACTIHARSSVEPNFTYEGVTIRCGRKEIVVSSAHSPAGLRSEDVSENLF